MWKYGTSNDHWNFDTESRKSTGIDRIQSTRRKTAKLKDEFGIITTTDNKEVAKQSDILVLSVKPQVYPAVIKEIRDEVSSEQIIVTIAAGVSMEAAERQFEKKLRSYV